MSYLVFQQMNLFENQTIASATGSEAWSEAGRCGGQWT